jgi:excisionase family DNA binding protein
MTMRLISPEEAAQRASLSRRAIYRAIQRGELTASLLCSRLRIREDDFDAWVEANRLTPSPRPKALEPLRPLPAPNGLRSLLAAASDEGGSR